MRHIDPLIIVASTALLAACAAAPGLHDGGSSPSSMQCNADNMQAVLGKKATVEVVEQARLGTHSRTARVLRPGQVVTMEFNAQRVDLRVDANDIILAVSCG
jgi:uncharacterized lipoprotein YajG